MYDITQLTSFFTELAFPIAVAGFLLFVTTKQLDKIRTSNLRIMIFLALIMKQLDCNVPDRRIDEFVNILLNDKDAEL